MAGTVTASVVKNDTTSPPAFQNSTGAQIGTLCRSFVQFNGATTVTINAQFNILSVTRASNGNYTITFVNNMPTTLYAIGNAWNNSNGDIYARPPYIQSQSASSFTTQIPAGDCTNISFATFA